MTAARTGPAIDGTSAASSPRGASPAWPTPSCSAASPATATRRRSRRWSSGTGRWSWATCRAVLRDAHDAEDAFQATFLVLARRAGTLRVGGESLGGWPAPGRPPDRRPVERPTPAAAGRSSGGRPLEAAAASSRIDRADELRAAVHREVGRLPDRLRLPVVLCHLEGKTHAQAAAELRWGEGTVRRRLADARELLRSRLVRAGIAPAVGVAGPAPARSGRPRPRPPGRAGRSPGRAATGRGGRRPRGGCRAARRLAASGRWRPAAMAAVGPSAPSASCPAGRPRGSRAGDRPDRRIPSGRRRGPPGRPGPPAGRRAARRSRSPAGSSGRRVAGGGGGALRLRARPTNRWGRPPSPRSRPRPAPRAASRSRPRARSRSATFPATRPATVVATLDGYGPAVAEPPANDGSLTLRLAPDDVPIVGRIVDRDGRPVAGATVRSGRSVAPRGRPRPLARGDPARGAAFPDTYRRLSSGGLAARSSRSSGRRRPGPTAGSASTGSAASGSPGSGSRGRRSRRPFPTPGPGPAKRSASASSPGSGTDDRLAPSTARRSTRSSGRGGPSSAPSATPTPGRRSPGRSSRARSPRQPGHHVATTTDAEGRYRLTGLPTDRKYPA